MSYADDDLTAEELEACQLLAERADEIVHEAIDTADHSTLWAWDHERNFCGCVGASHFLKLVQQIWELKPVEEGPPTRQTVRVSARRSKVMDQKQSA